LLEFDRASVVYHRKRPTPDLLALGEVSFQVKASKPVGIIGGSGAGKSTLCRVAEGLLRPSAGRVRVDGEDLAKWDNRRFAEGPGHTALERPDLVLMDMSLPVLDGWEAAQRLKTNPETRSILSSLLPLTQWRWTERGR